MKSIAIFLFGILSGYFLSVFLLDGKNTTGCPDIQNQHGDAMKQEVNQNAPWCEDRADASTLSHNKASHADIILSTQDADQHLINLPDSRSLINQLNMHSKDTLTSEPSADLAFTDLAFLVQKDAATSALIKQSIRDSTSYDIKWKLIHILANDHRVDTIDFAMEMITDGGKTETQKLGLELLSLLDVHEDSSFVSDTLIDATYAVSDPEVMTQMIHQLSQNPTDEATKERVTDRLQTMLSDSNPHIKAAVIDGLAEISQPQMIQELSRSYLFDSSDQVKNAAISALFKLNRTQVDQELLNTLTQLIQDPLISGETKRLATAVLETHDVSVSN